MKQGSMVGGVQLGGVEMRSEKPEKGSWLSRDSVYANRVIDAQRAQLWKTTSVVIFFVASLIAVVAAVVLTRSTSVHSTLPILMTHGNQPVATSSVLHNLDLHTLPHLLTTTTADLDAIRTLNLDVAGVKRVFMVAGYALYNDTRTSQKSRSLDSESRPLSPLR